jgi:hypothetical protein
MAFGLSFARLKAALGTDLYRVRHEITLFPNPLFVRADAILSGTHNVSGLIRELFGVGTNIVLGRKNGANGSVVMFRCIVFAI